MRFGVNILNFGPGISPDAMIRWAQVSEGLGYHAVLISDHVAITPTVAQRYPEPFYDTFTSLAWIAGQTKKIRLGNTVAVLPYRHAVLIARLVANIDNLSGGRFFLGTGVGNAEDEFRVLGQPFHRRGLLSDEILASSLALWQGTGPVDFKGKLVNFEGLSPIATFQKPHPPIWVGGAADGAIRRAARFGDAWHPNVRTVEGAKEGLAVLQAEAEKAGRPRPNFSPRMRMDIRKEDDMSADRILGQGSLGQVREDLHQVEALGADFVCLDWYTGNIPASANHSHGWEQLALLAAQVIDLEHEKLR